MAKKTQTKKPSKEKEKIVETKNCQDKSCPFHWNLKTRGKIFKGQVISKHPKRIAIEFERMIYIRKYERYTKTKTKIHARLPMCLEKDINIGDTVKIQECRPLSKIIHFVVLEKLNSEEIKKWNQ